MVELAAVRYVLCLMILCKRLNDMKLNLQSDARKIRKYIKRRIKNYPVYVNIGPGEDEDPIGLITVGFYAEQGGNLHVVFDTRPKAEVDGEWTLHIDEEENTLELPKWADAYDAICDDKIVSVTKHDGTSCTLQDSDGDEVVNAVFGDMLMSIMTDLRDDGSLAKLPLAAKAYMVIEEFDGRYFWPTYKSRKTKGRIAK